MVWEREREGERVREKEIKKKEQKEIRKKRDDREGDTEG